MKPLRIWFACVLGVTISTLLGWSNAMFMALFPVFVLVSLNRWNTSLFVQLILGIFWVSVQVSLIIGFLQPYPVLMLIAVGIMLLFKCFAMHHKSTYLFGYVGLLIGSILLNFGSYQAFDLENFIVGVWIAALMTLPICGLAFYCFPEPVTDQPIMKVEGQVKEPKAILEQTALGWLVAMAAFIIFQVGSLNDSLSAQASILVILAPMTLVGSMMAAKIRIIGTVAGCMAAMVIQFVLYDMFDNPILYLVSYAIAAGIFCRWLAKDKVWTGIGFSAISALTIPLTNTMVPGQQDAFFAILYRASSILVAVIAASLMIWLGHKLIKSMPWLFSLPRREPLEEKG
ncbi:Protein of unknown function (DUF2955) [Shewanella psychrophila]|uniref:DUF2955 domain-containing protein n=1 Tax=Shewanella psychrophila TaxID=225848 RepID=A0A1S6HPD6_9GAMM|nr:DUF2955 domain-containing protein [Shewanella psychrophila]AQS37368.1 Protein of unknown function (DUF2955) [Shewanella psychrophila]